MKKYKIPCSNCGDTDYSIFYVHKGRVLCSTECEEEVRWKLGLEEKLIDLTLSTAGPFFTTFDMGAVQKYGEYVSSKPF